MGFIEAFLKKKDVTKQDVEAFISRKIEENLNLDYKDIRVYHDFDELSKDVSAFANSEGGLILLGISQERVKEKGNIIKIFPKEITWGDGSLSKEKLEDNLISKIHPRIDFRILPIREGNGSMKVIFLIDIPQSDIPHMASDNRYYKRLNFRRVPMEHYEVSNFFVRSQKMQILREYIIGIVKAEYPSLFAELKLRSERLDNFLEKTEITYSFPKLKDIYEKGWIGFMEEHHHDLFLSVDYFVKNLLSKFEELARLVGTLRNGMWKCWDMYLEDTLPEEAKRAGKQIAEDLIRTINPYNVLPDLLNGRYTEAQNKIKKCFAERTSKYLFSTLNLNKISHSLIEGAKPEVEKLLRFYRELKKKNDRAVKKELLPLLQKYIINPV